MTDLALHTTPSPPRSSTQRPLPIPPAYESEGAAIELLLARDEEMSALLDDFIKTARQHFPGCKLKVSVDPHFDDGLCVDINVVKKESTKIEQDFFLWSVRANRRVGGRLSSAIFYP